MRKKYFLYTLLFSLPSIICVSQSKKQLYKAAVAAMENKDYENASYYYHLLLLNDSLNTDYQYQLATAARLNYQNDLSFYWYKKLFNEQADKYPDVIFYLGLLSKNKGDYKNAIKYFDKFYRKYKSEKKYPQYAELVKMAKQHIIGCENAIVSKETNKHIIIHHADSSINTTSSEYAPLMTDTALIFSSLRKTDESAQSKIYSASFKNDTFQKARPLPPFINESNINTANLCLYKNFIFFTKCKPVNATEFECKIYASKYINHHWTEPVELHYEINHPRYTTTHPFATRWNNKNVLFFSTNRPNGIGGMDIWYAFFDDQLNFEKPVNAGKTVNSEYDEITPFFDNKKHLLFYSSNHPKGFGGFDIFYSAEKNSNFETAVNMGFPVNSSFNDLYYTIASDRKTAWFSSNRTESFFESMPNCCNDIYYYPTGDSATTKDTIIPVLTKKDTIIQTFSKLKLLVPLTLFFHNDEPDPKTKKTTTDKNYQRTCELYLQMKDEYIREYSSGLKGEEKERSIELVTNFFEDSVEYGFSQLEKFAAYLEELMNNKATVKIVMKGYCSPLASTEYNINLAKRRISSLRNYFYQYKNGKLLPYIKNENDTTIGRIILVDEDIGELPFSKVSDNLKDKRNSVYSPYAAAERKIQIIAVELNN
ncbi:MAG: hypothetical protein Fur0023_07060 [Bacteroidia bacterium]